MKHYMVAAALVLSLPAMAQAQVTERMITAQGQAERDVTPDQARIDVNIENKGRELKAVKADNDKQLEALFKLAGELKIDEKHLKTNYASLQPTYRYNDGKQIFEGYQASTSVNITLKDMEKVGELTQKLVERNFTNVDNVQFELDNIRAVQDDVMLDALENARAKAEKMAARLGEKLGRPIQISEGYAQHERPQPMVRSMKADAMMAASAPEGYSSPPSGQQRITATATVSFELKD